MQSIANCEPYSNMRTLGKLLEISNNNNKPAWASLYHKLESLRWHIYTGHVMSWLAPHGIGGVLFYFTRTQIFCQVFAILCCNIFFFVFPCNPLLQSFSLSSHAILCCNILFVFPCNPLLQSFLVLLVILSEVSISLADGHNIFQDPVCRILFFILSFTHVHH